MKKISIVLLIAVLAVGFAFADATFTGSAELDFGYNFDTQAWGFENGTSTDLDWTLTLGEGEGSSVGEGDVYAEISGSFSLDVDSDDLVFDLTNGIDEANIIKGDLTVGILSADGASDYAEAYYDGDDDDDNDNAVSFGSDLAQGFNFSYDMFSGGFGAESQIEWYDDDAAVYQTTDDNIFAWVGVDGYALNEELTASVAAYGFAAKANNEDDADTSDNDISNTLGVAANLAYATDAMSANVAVDYDHDAGLEVALCGDYDPVAVDVYMYTADYKKLLLDAQVAATVEGFELSADARDLFDINDDRSLTLSENATFDALYQEVSLTINEFDFTDFEIAETVTYSTDMFDVSETLTFGFDGDGLDSIAPEVEISSDAIVDNATLALGWASYDDDEGDEVAINLLADDHSWGAVTASCYIEF